MKTLAHIVVAIVATTLVTTSAAAAAEPNPPGKAVGHDKQAAKATPTPKPTGKPTAKPTGKPASEPKPKPTNPGKAKGQDKNTPNGKAKGQGDDAPNGSGTSKTPSPKSINENEKITYCHVPPGNPDNGHLITTSVNAIDPGHLNHSGDIIPPFSFVKHGATESFAGQNWDATGQAVLANGCKPVAPGTTGSGTQLAPPAGGTPLDPTSDTNLETSGTTPMGGLTTSASSDVPTDDESVIDQLLPNTGGARLIFLVLGLGLVAAGVFLVTRRRSLV